MELGSGKLGKPCARRHRANAISACVLARCWAGLPSELLPGLPMMCWQAAWADLNAGWPEIDGLMPMLTELPLAELLTTGSGKLLTPCLRMHAENWYAAAPGPPFAPAAAPDEDVDEGELPPQPAAITATTTAATSTRPREGRGQSNGVDVMVGVLCEPVCTPPVVEMRW